MHTSWALSLPLRALGLLGRRWAPLLFWFTLGYLAHDLSLRGAAWLAHRNQWLGFAGLSIGVLLLLGSTIMMLHAVRPSLLPFGGRARGRESVVPVQTEQRRVVDQVAETILPFLVFYGAWGLFVDEVRTWGVHVINQDFIGGTDVLNLTGAATGVPLAIALGSWLVRAVCERFYNLRGGRLLGVVTALFEANWMFFAVISVSTLVGQATAWVRDREVWVAAGDLLTGLWQVVAQALPVFAQAVGWLLRFWPDAKDGLVLPLIWLVIASAVFGEAMDSDERLVAASRLERASSRFRALPDRVRLISDLFTREVRDKWTPLVNGLRFCLRAGALFYLTFCLCFVAIDLATGWAFVGVTHLIGPHPGDWWFPVLGVMEFAEQAVHDTLRVALLAATFELGLERGWRRRGDQVMGRVSDLGGQPAAT